MRFNVRFLLFAVMPWLALTTRFWTKITQHPPDMGIDILGLRDYFAWLGKVSFCVVFTLVWFIVASQVPAFLSWLRRYI